MLLNKKPYSLRIIITFSLLCMSLSSVCLSGQIVQYSSSSSQTNNEIKTNKKGLTAYVDLGYSFADWPGSYPYNFTSHGDGGLTFGLGISKKLNRYFNLQSNFFHLPKVDYDHKGGHSISQSITTTMAQMLYELSPSTTCYVSAGFGIRYTDFNDNDSVTLRPAMSVGIQRALNDYWSLQAQYLRINNVGDDGHDNYLPVSDIISLGIGYSF